MVQIIQTLKEASLEKLGATSGEELDISCYLTSSRQIDAIMEAHAHQSLGCKYVQGRVDLLKRLTKSYQGKYTDQVVEIGSSPEWYKD